jgi:hypothetical protein
MPKICRYGWNKKYCNDGSGDGSVVSIFTGDFYTPTTPITARFGPSASCGGWLNENEIVGQVYAPALPTPKVMVMNAQNGSTRVLVDDGAYFVAAGGDRWWAVTAHSGILVDGKSVDNVYVYEIASDGTIGYKGADGLGLRICNAGDMPDYKKDKVITNDYIWDVNILSKDWFCYTSNTGTFLYNNNQLIGCYCMDTPGNYGPTRAYWYNSNMWLTYLWYAKNTIVTHPYNFVMGFKVGTGNAFALDAYQYLNFQYPTAISPVIVWSNAQSNQAAHIIESQTFRMIDLRGI